MHNTNTLHGLIMTIYNELLYNELIDPRIDETEATEKAYELIEDILDEYVIVKGRIVE